MRKRIPRYSIALLLILRLLPLSAGAAEEAPEVSARAAVVAELETGRILFEKNPDLPMKAASTVKILTGLLALERLDMGEKITVRPEWTGLEGSSMYLRPGGEYTVSELLYGLLLVSGNDAAMTLACAVSGSEEAFVELMNQRAEAMKNALFRAIVSTKSAEVAGKTLQNHNKLLWRCEGAVGVKTGYTKAAGRTLVSCAERDGLALVCVTLDDPEDWADHEALLDWAFGLYTSADPGEMEWRLSVVSGLEPEVPVRPARGGRLLLPREARWEAELPPFVYAPVRAGERAGVLRCLDGEGVLLWEAPLVYGEDADLDPTQKLDFWEKLRWAWLFACRHSASYPQYVFY